MHDSRTWWNANYTHMKFVLRVEMIAGFMVFRLIDRSIQKERRLTSEIEIVARGSDGPFRWQARDESWFQENSPLFNRIKNPFPFMAIKNNTKHVLDIFLMLPPQCLAQNGSAHCWLAISCSNSMGWLLFNDPFRFMIGKKAELWLGSNVNPLGFGTTRLRLENWQTNERVHEIVNARLYDIDNSEMPQRGSKTHHNSSFKGLTFSQPSGASRITLRIIKFGAANVAPSWSRRSVI